MRARILIALAIVAVPAGTRYSALGTGSEGATRPVPGAQRSVPVPPTRVVKFTDLVLMLMVPLPGRAHAVSSRPAAAWFFELADGSTCRPLTGTGREIDGLVEIYTCRFALPGEADAVLGDLDASHPVWTIQQVLINKKIEPQTIKSTLVVPVKAVWQ